MMPAGAVSAAAGGLFRPDHVQRMLPALRTASASHPRLHSVWPSLLAFLLPGFKVDRVSFALFADFRSGLQKLVACNTQEL